MSNHMNTDEEKEKAVADALAVRARFAALTPAALQAAVAGLLHDRPLGDTGGSGAGGETRAQAMTAIAGRIEPGGLRG